jgi:capsular polysaccharide transport system permease protein
MPPRIGNFPIFGPLAGWFSKLGLLAIENFGFRYKRSRFDDILSIAEPLGVILVITMLHSLVSHIPPYGTSSFLFFATGIVPFYQFMHLARRTLRMDVLARQPRVTEFDTLLSHLIAEITAKFALLVVLLGGLYIYGIEAALPVNPLQCIAAMITLAVLGQGFGMVLGVATSFVVELRYVTKPFTRVLIFFSGAMSVMDYTPMPMAEILAVNPISHAIAWFRSGVYGADYPVTTMSLLYLFMATAAFYAMGLLLEATTKEWRPHA